MNRVRAEQSSVPGRCFGRGRGEPKFGIGVPRAVSFWQMVARRISAQPIDLSLTIGNSVDVP